ncbi:MAG: ComF family protein [Rhizobiaceae bacterium]
MEISRLAQKIRSITSLLANVVIPNTCLSCDAFVAEPGGCCASCWSELRFVQSPICPVMGTPFLVDMGDNFLSAEAIANPPPFDRLRTVLLYDERARRLVSTIKYSDRGDLLPWLARWMAVAGSELLEDADIVLPIPLHKSRLRKRRFNQSAELARHIGDSFGIEYAPELLLRHRATRQQVGLSQAQRDRNVSGAFIVPDSMKIHIKNRHILLVDDVYTTGATAKAAARALKRGGAGNIDVMVFAKVETGVL